jgi:hypothetical protein
MFTRLKAACFAALITATAAVATPAAADDGHFRHGHGHARFGIYFSAYPAYDYPRFRPRCTPERALYKAQALGVRAARIDYVSERRIGIVGRSHGVPVYLTFGREPGCPRF